MGLVRDSIRGRPKMMLFWMVASAADWMPWSPQFQSTLRSMTFGAPLPTVL